MAFRFRKSIKVIPGVRLNVSKGGLGISAGVRGARVGVNSRGTYTSVGIPGTGISSISYNSSGKIKTSTGSHGMIAKIPSRAIKTKTSSGVLWIVLVGLFLVAVNWIIGFAALALTFIWYQFFLKKQPAFHARKQLRDADTAYNGGQYQKAAEGFEGAYKFFSDDKAIALFTASAYSQLGQFDKAVIFMTDYLTVSPGDVEMQKSLARWYNELGDKDKALQVLQALNVNDVKDSGSLLLMTEILSMKGLDAGAIEVLKRAPLTKRTLTPDLVEIIYALGVLYEKIGDTKRSRSSFERVYAYDSSFRDVADRVK